MARALADSWGALGSDLFSIPRVNFIESDEGFSVETLGRTGLRAVEGDRTMCVNSEILCPASPTPRALCRVRIDRARAAWPPHAESAPDPSGRYQM